MFSPRAFLRALRVSAVREALYFFRKFAIAVMISELVKSIRNAPTIGTTRNALRRRAVLFRQFLHAGDRVRGDAEHEAAEAGGAHRAS